MTVCACVRVCERVCVCVCVCVCVLSGECFHRHCKAGAAKQRAHVI